MSSQELRTERAKAVLHLAGCKQQVESARSHVEELDREIGLANKAEREARLDKNGDTKRQAVDADGDSLQEAVAEDIA